MSKTQKNISTVKEIFKFVKLAPFIEQFAGMNSKGGIYHRINGKSTDGKTEKALTESDKENIRNGWEVMKKEVDQALQPADETN